MLFVVYSGASAATKCKAITQKGIQCKNNAKIDGYCKLHYDQIHATNKTIHGKKRCQSATQKGTQCKNNALNGSDYCHVHKEKHVRYDGTNKPVENPDRPEKAVNDFERCQAKTKAGARCKLKVISGRSYCPIHIK